MSNIIYRKAKINDCYSIAKLKGEVWNTTYRGIYSDTLIDNYDIKRNKLIFEGIISNPNYELYVAIDNKKIIGFMSCGEPYRPFLKYNKEIGLLYILNEYQRKGIGKMLFLIARDIVRKSGNDEFFVSVNKYNTNAIQFYIAMGGTIISIDEDKEGKSETQVKIHYTV